MIKNMPEEVTDIVRIKIKDKTLYRCVICNNEYPRRFNAERHYKRFHKTIQARKCCDETFYTKGDYYDHKENMHYERKRYGRRWKVGTQSSDSSIECNIAINEYGDCELDVISKTSISVQIGKERISEKCMDINNVMDINNAHNMQDNVKDSNSNNKEKFKNNMCPSQQSSKKIFIYRIKEKINQSQNITPLQSIENLTENSFKTLNALQNVVNVSLGTDKENIMIYDYSVTTISDLMLLMRNTINF